ncbi:hypothetical protein Q4F19_16765 [Sphingomonas sp. BIUV-7]|uniref:Cytochrome c domain-containing protein n=1 Tax=Sphingomonas natans TaxID=3063330 RepID=A0ABT8YCJ9_9SPHN|nr:hypothetical protein [Sphingomonas sp. BIUV-7]MDO6416044.1 hypothetical protein [Sphingomonas sp. BIUV-7]
MVGKRIAASRCVTLSGLALLATACHRKIDPVIDEAVQAGVADDHFVHAGEDYFRDMDNGVALSPEEVKGRNMWLVWSGGNDRFWDRMGKPTLGTFDLLKIVAPPPGSPLRRPTRWRWLGAVNEPCFQVADTPDPIRFGLYFDQRQADCPADPFADETKYPGVMIGARGTTFADGKTLPLGSYYGWPTGIVGLRLFPNPAFDAAAEKKWDPVRYYNDPAYYQDPNLVRPYRVGMACAFCHVGPSPMHPPADPANPKWSELNSTVGAQYLWSDRLFFWKPNEANFVYQWIRTYRPGALDTSLVSTDNINNPRTQNAIYELGARLRAAKPHARETLAGGGLDNAQFNQVVRTGWLTDFFQKPATVWTPHVLKDGADSVGALGALNRVFLNIGLFSEEWLRHFNPVVGGKPPSPIRIADARAHSAYWRATEKGTPAIALFFLKAAQPDRLADAPGGRALLAPQAALVSHGADVFAQSCARCHSSKQPDRVPSDVKTSAGDYLDGTHRWWRWTQSGDYQTQMRAIVHRPDFLADNYLSTDRRIPVTLLRTNLCSPLATNAIAGNIWDNFSSQTYKTLPAVGTVSVINPFTGQPAAYKMPGGGRGYTRVPSLISLWSTAPYLVNNTVGPFSPDPSVATRYREFQSSIEQMLWPERRAMDSELGARAGGLIDRTTRRTYLFVPKSYLLGLQDLLADPDRGLLRQLVNKDGDLVLGPIPKGVPINLLASLQPLAESKEAGAIAGHYHQVLVALTELKKALIMTKGKSLDDHALRQAFASLRAPLLQLSKCPDFVVNRGHYFGTAQFNQGRTADERSWGEEAPLAEADKKALIAFLATL